MGGAQCLIGHGVVNAPDYIHFVQDDNISPPQVVIAILYEGGTKTLRITMILQKNLSMSIVLRASNIGGLLYVGLEREHLESFGFDSCNYLVRILLTTPEFVDWQTHRDVLWDSESTNQRPDDLQRYLLAETNSELPQHEKHITNGSYLLFYFVNGKKAAIALNQTTMGGTKHTMFHINLVQDGRISSKAHPVVKLTYLHLGILQIRVHLVGCEVKTIDMTSVLIGNLQCVVIRD